MALSPMMQQYTEIKERYPDCIIFFRLGDFYEMFFEQAELCSRELELTLTGKDCGEDTRAPMCGIPFHSVDGYIARLVEKGYKIAICEQIEDPKLAKGLVQRDIVKIITPGTITENNILDESESNYIGNIYCIGREYAVSIADISTGKCFVTCAEGVDAPYRIVDEVLKIAPKELVLDDNMLNDKYIVENVIKKREIYVSRYINGEEKAVEELNVLPKDITIAQKKSLTLLINYILDTQKSSAIQINNVNKYDIQKYMRLDQSTIRNLEIVETNRGKSKKGSLLWVIDKTTTAMGSRLLKNWIENPLVNKSDINPRLYSTDILLKDVFDREQIISILKNVRDTERLATKIAYASGNARDMISLKNSLEVLPELKSSLYNVLQSATDGEKEYLIKIYNGIDEMRDIYTLIESSIEEDPPVTITEGGIIKKGYDETIDELKTASTDGKSWIMALEATEREETGIKGLKIGYNRVFGYYIEITKSNFKDVPEGRYIRKQTLVDKERFITPELKEIENKILGSEEKLVALEYKLFCEIREKIASEVTRIQRVSEAVAELDVLCSFAKVSVDNNFVMPKITDSGDIIIKDGRHPVVEKTLKESAFIPNDTTMNSQDSTFHIITGPNMAGKSTYMRQVAIIVYMAQIGCFVPASEATIGIVDRIFTRVGASDDLAGGESTFMVEMMELSNILQNASEKSLLILDEIGRGTSTYDGMAIAWSTVEHITSKIKAKTLFATHYHELVELENSIDGIKNYSVAVKEKGDDVIFLRKIVEGAADESYGIYVAKLAGIPSSVVTRAKTILKKLEEDNIKKQAKENDIKVVNESLQVDMFNYKLAEVGRMLDIMSLDELTAKEALDALYKLKEKMK